MKTKTKLTKPGCFLSYLTMWILATIHHIVRLLQTLLIKFSPHFTGIEATT